MICSSSAKPNTTLSTQVSPDGQWLPEMGSVQTIRRQAIHHSQGAGNHTPTQPPSSSTTPHKGFQLCTWGPKSGKSPQEGKKQKGLARRRARQEGFASTLLLQVALNPYLQWVRSFSGSPLAQDIPVHPCLPTISC